MTKTTKKKPSFECMQCGKKFRAEYARLLCFNCLKTKPKKMCSGGCNREFRPKTELSTTCDWCKTLNRRTASAYAELANPDFPLGDMRARYRSILLGNDAECRYCQGKLTVKNFSLDHKQPRERGGDDSEANLDFQCCSSCNTLKGNMNLDEAVILWGAIRQISDEKIDDKPSPRGRLLAALKTGSKLRMRFVRRG